MRSCILLAALLVKVMAAMLRGLKAAILNQIGDFLRDDPRLARAGTGQHQQGAVEIVIASRCWGLRPDIGNRPAAEPGRATGRGNFTASADVNQATASPSAIRPRLGLGVDLIANEIGNPLVPRTRLAALSSLANCSGDDASIAHHLRLAGERPHRTQVDFRQFLAQRTLPVAPMPSMASTRRTRSGAAAWHALDLPGAGSWVAEARRVSFIGQSP